MENCITSPQQAFDFVLYSNFLPVLPYSCSKSSKISNDTSELASARRSGNSAGFHPSELPAAPAAIPSLSGAQGPAPAALRRSGALRSVPSKPKDAVSHQQGRRARDVTRLGTRGNGFQPNSV